MRAKLTILSALVMGLVGGVLATGCQTYDFEPVEPLAIAQTTETRRIEAREAKPNLMLLVDTSGSMAAPINKSLSVCQRNGEVCGDTFPCDARCETRWTALQKAMTDFLGASGSIARMGLARYPSNDSCGSTANISISLPPADKEDDATLVGNAQSVLGEIMSIKGWSSTAGDKKVEGGTPTAESLRFMGNLADLQTDARSDFVVLLTDGLPNCNESYPDPYPSTKCFCTVGDSCQFTPNIGCLDTNASVAAVNALRAKNIKTIVIGFGADFSSKEGSDTLNGMAEAGGFARSCTQNADCGTGDTCNTTKGLCNRGFYQAGNRDELIAALRQISEKVSVGDPCLLTFDAAQRPSSAELVVVYVNGERLASGSDTWTLKQPNNSGVEFLGSTCQRIKSSSPSNPVNIEVRAVQQR
ncbi:adventurous gliding motility lipoprotein CglB [Archangium sp.]|uniref:adventurous gliding motility lipoprotein CglB n=1 Tax=Archangium sp. TaxID=1872627 RepID=UPI00286ABE7B|nr:adventurous gliding motility lipoprotein CglB [Archangium sp.]